MRRLFYYVIFGLIINSISTITFASAPVAWSFWDKSNQNSNEKISHKQWQEILNTYLVEKNNRTFVNYKKLKANSNDHKQLKSYIKTLTQLDPRKYNLKEQFAYWINLYNATTVDLILENYPVQSIKKIGSIFESGPWDKKLLTIEGQAVSLNAIEHQILRPIWKEKNTHYLLNCASLGCPNLQSKAVTAQNQKQLLEKGAYDFINNSKGVKIKNNKSAQISSLYKWYKVDFGDNAKLVDHLNSYLKTDIKLDQNVSFSYAYDWNLNSIE